MHPGRIRSNKEQLAEQTRRPSRRVVFLPLAFLFLTIASPAQTPVAGASGANQSWSATSESADSTTQSRTRTVESHSQIGNRTVDKQSIELLRSGRFQPFQDIETESLKLNDTTVRTVVRTYTRNADGERILFQVTEEEKQTQPDGAIELVRSTSNPDANGNLQLVQREVQDTRKTSPNGEETTTTVFMPGVNGGLAPVTKTQETQERTSDQSVQSRKSTLLPNADGTWRVGEIRQGTITQVGKDRSTDERISRPAADGQLSEVSRTITKESQAASGESRETVEDYSTNVPGSTLDGSLHLVQRVTTTGRDATDGTQTSHRQVEQVNPGDPSAGLRITVISTDATTASSSGTDQTRTIQSRDANGNLNVVSVDMTQSTKLPAVQLQIAAPKKPKSNPK